MKILLLGANGQVGFELQRSLSCLGEVIACQREQLDLTDTAAIQTLLTATMPNLIVNAAGYTAVDKAEQESIQAHHINAAAPRVLAEFSAENNVPLIHYSTDYVFDGENDTAWRETDRANPLNTYGQTKLEGEQAIQQSGCDYLIFRTSWVYDQRGQNFLKTMLRLAETKTELNVVNDQYGAPTWSRHIADVTALIISQSLSTTDFWQKNTGLYHLTAAGKTSWQGFAEAIFELHATARHPIPKVNGIATAEYPTPAKRPRNSCLDNTKLHQHFGLKLPDWQDSLRWVMQA